MFSNSSGSELRLKPFCSRFFLRSLVGLIAFCCLNAAFLNAQSLPVKRQAQAVEADSSSRFKVTSGGISVQLSIKPVEDRKDNPDSLLEDDNVLVSFTLADAGGEPISNALLTAWLDSRQDTGNQSGADCSKKIASFLSAGYVGPQPIDLNRYYVLGLNEDSTITVVDPRFGYGGSRLLALIQLKSVGDDWSLTDDQSKLFVSMPDSNQVAVAATDSWKIITNLDSGVRPTRLALQPDQHYLWVACERLDANSKDSGVVVIDVSELKVVARIPTGRGSHSIAFSEESQFAFVTNRDEGTVSVIDVRSLKKVRDVFAGRDINSIAYSEIARLAYAISEKDGTVAALSSKSPEAVARIQADSGLYQIRFAQKGRYGFITNPTKGKLYIIDSSSNRLIQSADISDEPDLIAFSNTLAYIRRRKSESIDMVSFSQIGHEGRAISVADFPGGQYPFNRASRPSLADSIVKAPGENAVLVGNPADKSIYFYSEGMAAPMGNFSNYGRQPRAVQVVNRTLREVKPGLYQTISKLRGAGRYTVAFLLDSPRITHCFEIKVDPNPAIKAANKYPARVEPLASTVKARVGNAVQFKFRLIDNKTGHPVSGLKDVEVLAVLASGTWQKRQQAEALEDGVYAIDLVPPEEGAYYLYVSSLSLGLRLNNHYYVVLDVEKTVR